jgi:hypothetical protein
MAFCRELNLVSNTSHENRKLQKNGLNDPTEDCEILPLQL